MLLKDNKSIKNVFLNNLEVKKIYLNEKIVFEQKEEVVELMGTVTTSNNNGLILTKDDVTAILITNLPIKTPTGWEKVDDKTFSKVYENNTKTSVTIVTLDDSQTVTVNFEVKRIDKIAPTATIKTGSTETIVSGDAYILISFKLHDANGLASYTLNGKTVVINGAQWSDINYVKIGQNGGIAGNNILILTDKAGNSKTYEFTLVAE